MKVPVNRSTARVRAALVLVAALALALCVAAPALAVVPQFAAPVTYTTGAGPHDIAEADFDLDGIADIAVPNAEGDTVSILKGTAAGGYAAATSIKVGDRPFAIVAADFNRDGKSDLAVTNRGSDTVSVLLNNGTGGFTVAQTLTVGDRPTGIASGDFDRNGRPDLIVAIWGENSLAQLNNGPGTVFTLTARPLPLMPFFLYGPSQLVVADFDRSGTDDVAVGTMFGIGSLGASSAQDCLLVLPGDGAGAFLASSFGMVPGGVVDLEACDLNRDGFVEIVGASWSGQSVWWTTPGGALTVIADADTSQADFFPIDVALGELNNPGLIDAVVSLPRRGVIEFDVDAPDMFLQFVTDKEISGGLSDPRSDPRTRAATETAGAQPGALALIDVNRDGALDTVSLDFDGNKVRVLRRTLPVRHGFGYEPAATWLDFYAAEPVPAPGVAADLDNDGLMDAFTPQTILHNQGPASGPTFSATAFAFAGLPVCSGDFDRDGWPDVVTSDAAGNALHVYLGDGLGGLAPAVDLATGAGPAGAAAGDVDNDGDLDLVSANSGAGTVSVLRNNGAGGFAAAADTTVGAGPAAVALADLDNDGDLDIVAANNGSASVSMLRNNGSGVFAAKVDTTVGANPQSLAVGDFDRNGRADAAVGRAPGSVDVLLGNGSGGFAAAVTYAVAAGSRQLVASDLSTDGTLDLVASGGGAGPAEVTVLSGSGTGTFAAGSSHDLFAASPGGTVVGDFDGDGVDDIVVGGPDTEVAHAGTGAVYVITSDTTPPQTVAVPAWGDPANAIADEALPNYGWPEWINAAQPVTFGGTDTGAGYDKTVYRVDTLAAYEAGPSAYAATAALTIAAPADHDADGKPEEGKRTHYFYSVDRVGNAEDRQVRPVGIDTVKPKAVVSGDAVDGPSGWVGIGLWAFDMGIIDPLSGPRQPDPSGPEAAVWIIKVDGASLQSDVASFEVPAPSDHRNDGIHEFQDLVRDDAGNDSDTLTTRVRVDTRGPDTYALKRVVINYYGSPTLSYKVLDLAPNGGTADVTIQIKNSKGAVKKTISFTKRKIGVTYKHSFWCKLARGTYTYYVYATDTAGNKQVNLGSNKLIVR